MTHVDADGLFEAVCSCCGLVVLDVAVFDHEVYPQLCAPVPGHHHVIDENPGGAGCHLCGVHLDFDWAAVYGRRPGPDRTEPGGGSGALR